MEKQQKWIQLFESVVGRKPTMDEFMAGKESYFDFREIRTISGFDLDKTAQFSGDLRAMLSLEQFTISVFDQYYGRRTIRLTDFGKSVVTFGRGKINDIVLKSPLVSYEHGRFIYENGRWFIEERVIYTGKPTSNGLLYNNVSFFKKELHGGDVIRIDDAFEANPDGVLFLYGGNVADAWESFDLSERLRIVIGRGYNCEITLPHISVSKQHAIILQGAEGYYLNDTSSSNGILVNNQKLVGNHLLKEKDVFSITNTTFVFSGDRLYYFSVKDGVSVEAHQLLLTRGRGKKEQITGNYISTRINPGELVAIVGGSGAGKSTFLNALSGYLRPKSGMVAINGQNLYRNFDVLKDMIGYVPQSDIVYDNLTLYDMLKYTAKLRLPKDLSDSERQEAIERAISLVELTDKKLSYIRSLSGGQRKRASIAVELLSDPNLLFLDEPSSGLDPWTERQLMASLKTMTNSGKTVILVTHSTLQLELCDRIIFMGKGGNLCFSGSYEEALAFFGVSDLVDVYQMITDSPQVWREKYSQTVPPLVPINEQSLALTKEKKKKSAQLSVLSSRYLKLVVNDRQRLLLLLLQAPLLAGLISLVGNGEQFNQYEMTKSLLFALSCSAFWMGMLNAIQEICKERTILRREYMAGLSLNAYLISKISILGLLCLIQAILSIVTFGFLVGSPEQGLITLPLIELFLTTFLTALAASAMGLSVSALFRNPDRAMTVAPLLLMPQILFSGLIFKLDGITELISYLALCRFSMEAYGTTANLNQLELKLQQEGVPLVHEIEAFFDYSSGHLLSSWGIILFFTLLSLLLARLVLNQIKLDN